MESVPAEEESQVENEAEQENSGHGKSHTDKDKKDKKERARERREKRRQEISLLRTIPYSDHQKWWSSETIALVTGANRGIGFEIAHQLAQHGLTIILTSRETAVGEEAAKVLQEGGLNVVFHQLDIIDPSSIKACADWVQETYGGLDILLHASDTGQALQINNAGANYNCGSENSVEHAEQVIQTNYYGTKNVTQAMVPIMRQSDVGARIVNVSSKLGKLHSRRNKIEDVALREQLSDTNSLSEELIDKTVNTFLEQVKDGTWESGGWPQTNTEYSVSKLAVNCYTRLMARILSERPEGQKIYVNCYCPGWVKTAMTGWAAGLSPEEGADTAVWLALLPDHLVTGKFFFERRETHF